MDMYLFYLIVFILIPVFFLHLKILQVDKAMGPEGKNKKFMENAQTYPEFSKVRNILVNVGFKYVNNCQNFYFKCCCTYFLLINKY